MENADEKPWNEKQWERFLQESDARTARFSDLFETLLDHPNRDEIIDREMGWQHREGSGDELDHDDEYEADEDDDDELLDGDDESFGEVDSDLFDNSDERLARRGPEYELAYKVARELHAAFQPYLKGIEPDASDERGERLGSAYIHSQIPAAKIAGARGIGEEDEAICGQIVYLKRALAANEMARADIDWLVEQAVLPAAFEQQHGPRLDDVSEIIRKRIAELRARVWWD